MSRWIVESCAEVRAAELEWLWRRYLPRGKLVILDGDPGMAKTLLCIDLIARLSRGSLLPDGKPLARSYTSALLSAEDKAEDTIRPWAEAAGVDLSRFLLPRFKDRLPRFPEETDALEELVVERSVDLVVIDPLMAFLSTRVPASMDQYVRQALTPLAKLAEWTGCTILMLRHLIKQWQSLALLRGLGSIGISAAARTTLFAGPHPTDPEARVLAVSKTNLDIRPPALGYRVVANPAGQPVVEWMGPVDVTADALGAKKKPEKALKMSDRAVDWLRRELANGPRKSADIFAAAAEAWIPERTLYRAKDWLPAKSHKVHDRKADRSEWWWYDPAAPWPKTAPFKKPDPLELPPLEW
jgi:AAA domain